MSAAIELSLEARPESAGRARRAVRELLEPHGLDSSEAELLVSELVGNSVRYAGDAPIRLQVHLDGGVLRVELRDADAALPQLPEAPAPEAESGRGLLLVEALATSWGAEPDGPGKRLWFEVTPGPAHQPGSSARPR